MAELPDNVDLQWIGRNLLALRRDLQSPSDDIAVMAAILRRVDGAQIAFRDELRALFDLHRDLRAGVERLEDDPSPHLA